MKTVLIGMSRSSERYDEAAAQRIQTTSRALRDGGIEVIPIENSSEKSLETRLSQIRPELVFSTEYHTFEDPRGATNINGWLDAMGYSYIGSPETVLELVLSKADLKAAWRRAGVRTPWSFLVKRLGNGSVAGWDGISAAREFPYIIKPSGEGNSRGIGEDSVVFTRQEMLAVIENRLEMFDELLVERFLGCYEDIREFTVSMIGSGNRMLLMPAEIKLKVSKEVRVITTSDKDDHLTQAQPVLQAELKQALSAFAGSALRVAGVRDYARCDIILAGDNLYAIEINGQPMVPDKWFGSGAWGAGMDESQYLNAILLAGLSRCSRKDSRLSIPEQMSQALPETIFSYITEEVIKCS